jgi:hypothetical protein
MNITNIKKGSDNLKSISLKTFLLLTIFSILFILPFVSAVQIETKDSFLQGETLIAKISGNFVDQLGSGNILFYRGHVRVPTQFTLSKINDDYYLYALLLGKGQGNYSLQIQGVKYKVATQVKDDAVIRNFTITNETADFYAVPGFVKTKDDFSIELTNLKDNSIEVEIVSENSSTSGGFFESLFGTGSSTQTITLSSGQTKKINFLFDGTLNESTLRAINLSSENTSYSIPLYMEVNGAQKSNVEGTGKLSFEPLIINVSLATGSNTTRIVYLHNKEDLPVKNISIYVSEELQPYVNISAAEVSEIDKNSSMRIDLFFSSGESEKNLTGQITARYENTSGDDSEELFARAEIFLNFIEDYTPQYEENITVIDTKTCAQLNGTICNTTIETCSGESVYAKDNKCCLSACTPIAESSSTGKYIGWGLVALVVLFVGWFLIKRYRKTSTPVDLLKIARGRR